MNVMDDARAPLRARRPGTLLSFALLFAAAAAMWPPSELPLWRTRVPGGAVLGAETWSETGVRRTLDGTDAVYTGGSAARVEAAAQALVARRDPASGELLAAGRAVVAEYAGDVLGEPLTERETCVALLLSRAALLEALVRRLPGPYAAAAPALPVTPPLALLATHQDIALAAQASDPVLLGDAIARAHATELRWFASGVPAREASTAARGRAWRDWLVGRSAALRALASTPLTALGEPQVEHVSAALPAYLASQADEAVELFAALGRGGQRLVPLPTAPVWPVWVGWVALAALVGGWIGAAFGAAFARRRPEPRERLTFTARRDPARVRPALHVVAGASPRGVVRGVLELAAHTLAARGRVLVVETSPRLGLHAVLEREARWGLAESLSADMPILGLVQFGGRPGLYFLAHGHANRRPAWPALGRRLDDIEPHFDRIVLAVAADAPAALGDAIVGRALEGWWADGSDRLTPAAEKLGDRLSMAFSCMDLSVTPEPSLEALGRRIAALEPTVPRPVPVPALLPVPAPGPRSGGRPGDSGL